MPALQALLIQLVALGLVLLCAVGLANVAEFELTIALAVSAQGVVAAGLAWWRGMARWWLWIHLLFAPALVLLLALQLPSWIYLLLFCAMLTLYWQTFRTQVPFYPSAAPVWQAVDELLPTRPIQFIDIGSGFGGLVVDLAARRPDCSFSGIELAPLPWLCSVIRARLGGSRAIFVRGDYMRLDLGQFDMVFSYLSPAAMAALWRKANAEMRPGSLLLSYEFAIPDIPPHITRFPQQSGPALYGWRF